MNTLLEMYPPLPPQGGTTVCIIAHTPSVPRRKPFWSLGVVRFDDDRDLVQSFDAFWRWNVQPSLDRYQPDLERVGGTLTVRFM
jgi:hypothetical protein